MRSLGGTASKTCGYDLLPSSMRANLDVADDMLTAPDVG